MTSSQADLIQTLSSRIRRMEKSRLDHFHKAQHAQISTGIKRVDSLLPNRGLLRGTLTEWISADSGCGALSLAILAAVGVQRSHEIHDDEADTHEVRNPGIGVHKLPERSAGQQSGRKRRANKIQRPRQPVVIIDPQRTFYVPAAIALGLNPRDTILIRPQSADDALWALEQALRHSGPAAVLCHMDHTSGQKNDQIFRRLQLACETGNSLGLLIRPDAARRQTCWAEVRFRVSSAPSEIKPQPADYLPVASTLPFTRTPDLFADTAEQNLRAAVARGPGRFLPRHSTTRCVHLELLAARGRMSTQTVPLEICDATGCVRVAAQLRDSAVSERTRRISRPTMRAV